MEPFIFTIEKTAEVMVDATLRLGFTTKAGKPMPNSLQVRTWHSDKGDFPAWGLAKTENFRLVRQKD